MRLFLHGTAMLAGLIIGVGIFGVPYTVAASGWLAGLFWLLVLGGAALVIHLFYGEVVAAIPGRHRLAGYSKALLGPEYRRLVMALDALRFWGVQIAYIIVGGIFLRILIGSVAGGDVLIYSAAVFGFVALVTFFGLHLVDRVEFYLSWILVAALAFIFIKGIPYINAANFTAAGGNFFASYGVIMVALAGSAAIPEIWEITKGNRRVFRASIAAGTFIPIVITGLFVFVVVGISGAATSAEGFAGLQGLLGSSVIFFGAFIGLAAIVTSYLVIALYLQESFEYDFLTKHTLAWLAAVGVPFLVFLAGARDFIDVVDVIGSVLLGGGRMLIVALALVLFARRRCDWWRFKIVLGVLVILILAVGIIQEVAGWF